MRNASRSVPASATSGSSPGSASGLSNGVTVHQPMPRSRAADRTAASGWNAAAPRSTGAWPPAAAFTQDASRNSWLVRTRSAARARIRSGSQASTRPPGGTWSSSSSIRSASTGANASMPSTPMPSASLPRISARPGWSLASCLARSRTAGVSSNSRHGGAHRPSAGVQAALVGDPEVADLLDAVPPELHPQRVFLGGREHVQDAAAHGDLAAVLDQVGAHVADVHQPGDGLLEVGVLACAQRHRFQVAQPADHRLQQAAHRADQHGDRAGLRAARVRVGQPAQHGQPPPGGVRTRRDPFVRQGFPGREAGHRAWRQQRLEGAGQLLRLARGGRHGQHEPLRLSPGLIRPRWGGGQRAAAAKRETRRPGMAAARAVRRDPYPCHPGSAHAAARGPRL